MSENQSAILHFSNRIETLLEILKENLFPKNSHPFEKRLVVVPHAAMKSYIMQYFADDPDLQIAAGMQIVNLSGAYSKMTKKRLPTKIELSFFIQHELISLIERYRDLEQYFSHSSKEKRMGPFCDQIAKYFLHYLIYGKNSLNSWQEELWKKVSKRWFFPAKPVVDWQVHLFGFTHIPKSYFTFFQANHAKFYLFSPCEIFWGDFYSEKELSKMQLDLFDQQNLFLSNWGKVGRKMLLLAEETSMISQEHYVQPEGSTCLEEMQQDLLAGTQSTYLYDETIEFFSAPSLLREVEILKEKIESLYPDVAPSDIQVFAPDINLYAPYIEAVFKEDIVIEGIAQSDMDPKARAFSTLMKLCENRFSLEYVLQVLRHMDFDIPKIQKWLEAAHIRFGFSKKQKNSLYLQDFEKQDLRVVEEEGTFERGLQNLLYGLTDLNALNVIDMTDCEEFDRLYNTVESLADDLSVLHDGTKWTISTWLRYFSCLMDSYISTELIGDLGQLAATCDHLDQETFTYEGVKRSLTNLFQAKNQVLSSPHLQTIRFSSLTEGAVLPGKVICLLGMQEDAFPQTEENSSLYFGEKDYRPKKSEEDRYLFLQTLCLAKEKLIMSYVRDSTGKWGRSSLMQEVIAQIEGAEVIPYSQELPLETEAPASLIETQFELIASNEPMEISIPELFRFARNPLRFYLHEVKKIKPYMGRGEDVSAFLLHPLMKYELVRRALKAPVDEVIEHAKKVSELPVNLFLPLAKEQIQNDVDAWKEAIELFGAEPRDYEIDPIKIGRYTLVGEIRDFSEKGMFVNGKNTLEDHIRFWPHILLMQHLGLKTFFIKEKETVTIEASLEEYLDYYAVARNHPSFLLPSLAKSLIQGSSEDFIKAVKTTEDETLKYLLLQEPSLNLIQIHANWQPYLHKLFGGLHADV